MWNERDLYAHFLQEAITGVLVKVCEDVTDMHTAEGTHFITHRSQILMFSLHSLN